MTTLYDAYEAYKLRAMKSVNLSSAGKITKFNNEATLAQKLKALAECYLHLWENSSSHSHQDCARLLTNLNLETVSDAAAFKTLTSVFNYLPRKGQLFDNLVHIIDEHTIIPEHKAAYGTGTYHDVIHNFRTNEGYNPRGFAKLLTEIDVNAEKADMSLAEALQAVGEEYMAKHQTASSCFNFWSSHTHQTQAQRLENVTDENARTTAQELLETLSNGELKRGIEQVLATHPTSEPATAVPQ